MMFLASVRSRLTYANIVSSVCLFLVLGGGTAVALTGANTVFSDDITNGEVKNGDIASNAVSNPKLRNDSVGGGKVAPESLSGGDLAGDSVMGADVDEDSLAAVPSAVVAGRATNADNATDAVRAQRAQDADTVDGLHARTFSLDVAEGGSFGRVVLNLGGLTLATGACAAGDASGSFSINATTATNNSFLRKDESASPDQDDDFDVGESTAVKAGSDGSGLVVYHSSTGGVVTVNLAWSKTATRCFLFGSALGS